MSRRKYIILLAGVAALLLALLVLAGCGGDDEQASGAYECDVDEASIIPPPSGKPQLIYFYKDT